MAMVNILALASAQTFKDPRISLRVFNICVGNNELPKEEGAHHGNILHLHVRQRLRTIMLYSGPWCSVAQWTTFNGSVAT